MSDYITTYSGAHFVPVEPVAADVHITDIAHALSMLCRGNGHVKQFFSVGQHCIHCAQEAKERGYGKRICLACLLHDASEAYMSDITRPLKKCLREYRVFEERLLAVIYQKYLGSDLTEEEEKIVKKIDDDMLYFDLKVLLNEPSKEEEPRMASRFSYDFVSFAETETRYLELFREFGGLEE